MPDLAARRASLFKDLFLRDDTSCPTGEQFYHCGSNGFRGCCSVDPCDLRRCPDLPSKVFVTWTLPGIADADGTATASLPESTTASDDEMLTTKTSTTSKETEVTTTTTIASTRTLTRTHKSTIEEEITSEETTSGEAITQEPETEKTTLTKGTTVTDTKTEPTTLVSVTREATTHTEKHTLTTSHRVLVPLTTSSTIAADRDDVLDTAQDNDEESNDNRKLSPGQIGGTVGGVVVLCILLAVAAFVMLRRRAARRKTQPQPRPVSSNDGSTSDKDYTPVAMTSPSGQDPFAPFGGRAHKSSPASAEPTSSQQEPIHEVEDTSIGLVELPGEGILSRAETSEPRGPVRTPGTRREDPRATLNATINDRGRPAFVNYWNHYQP